MSLLTQWRAEERLTLLAAQQLSRYVDLLLEWNPRINLTGLDSREEVEEVLVGESLLAAEALGLSSQTVLDFGSGAGIPGLIWLTRYPSLRLTSVEVRAKKIAFQKEVTRTLRLPAKIVQGHFPEAVAGDRFDIIVTRAIRFSRALRDSAMALLAPGGLVVRFAAADAEEEPGWERFPISSRSSLFLCRRTVP